MILGLENFKIKQKELIESNPKIKVKVKFKYPSVELKKYKPKNRLKLSKEILLNTYREFKSEYKRCKPLGGNDIYGVEFSLRYNELKEVQKNEYVEYISLVKIEGIERKKKKKIPIYFSVVTKILIEVEGLKKSKSSNELRIILVGAISSKDAKKKVTKGIKKYEKPYLNPYGKIVQWKLEEIIHCYETTISDEIEVNDEYGVEIYSRIFKNEKSIQKVIKEMNK
ncbi:MAG: DUF4288 domain-containing protein [Bacteroidota bacterium]